MTTRARVSVNVHLDNDTVISTHQLDVSPAHSTVVLALGESNNGISVFVDSREQAERLFDVVAEVADLWRQLKPEQATVDAVLAPGDIDPETGRRVERVTGSAEEPTVVLVEDA